VNLYRNTLLICFSGLVAAAFPVPLHADSPEILGWTTNGSAVFSLQLGPAKVAATSTSTLGAAPQSGKIATNAVFDHYLPRSLNNLVWTNFIAHTNGRDMLIWATRSHPAGWPAHPPLVTWNRKSLLWGMKGMTALSPCWEKEGAAGQVPITALTRRHVYTRGHGMGPDGFNENFAGKKIWFLTTNNVVIEAKVLRDVVRMHAGADYTILLLTRDLPSEIEPMAVVNRIDIYAKFPEIPGAPRPVFRTEQEGHVSAGVEGWNYRFFKGGDSGSPDMLPMPGELFFINGRTTSPADAAMQADMDQLSKSAKLDPKNYQLRWLDITGYP
jgi:hypothetical protein